MFFVKIQNRTPNRKTWCSDGRSTTLIQPNSKISTGGWSTATTGVHICATFLISKFTIEIGRMYESVCIPCVCASGLKLRRGPLCEECLNLPPESWVEFAALTGQRKDLPGWSEREKGDHTRGCALVWFTKQYNMMRVHNRLNTRAKFTPSLKTVVETWCGIRFCFTHYRDYTAGIHPDCLSGCLTEQQVAALAGRLTG